MKYLLLELNKEKYWFELDSNRYVNRQMVLDEYNKFHISCLEDCLAEGSLNETDIDGNIISIDKQAFENMWQSVLKKYKRQWEEIKKIYPVGAWVKGVNKYVYPQGTIIKGKDFIAVYKGDETFYLNKSVEYKIKSYDDLNMWLVVE